MGFVCQKLKLISLSRFYISLKLKLYIAENNNNCLKPLPFHNMGKVPSTNTTEGNKQITSHIMKIKLELKTMISYLFHKYKTKDVADSMQ